MGKLERSKKGIEGLKAEHNEDLIDDTISNEEELSFEEILKKSTKSNAEIAREDAERRQQEVDEAIKTVENSKDEVQSLRESIKDIFG